MRVTLGAGSRGDEAPAGVAEALVGLVVIGRTAALRECASTVVRPGVDVCADVGCSYGGTTAALLGAGARRVVALDVSAEAVEKAREAFGDDERCTVHVADALEDGAALRDLCAGAHVVAVDLGGTRESAPLVRVVDAVLRLLSPRVVLVKCERLLTSARRAREAAGAEAAWDGEQWWRHLREQVRVEHRRAALEAYAVHPCRLAPRKTSDGRTLCRRRNFVDASEAREGVKACEGDGVCPFDHEHCSLCGWRGHLALNCPGDVLIYVASA